MVSMSSGIDVSATVQGGVLRSAARSLFAQEKFFTVRYTAHISGAWVAIAPRFPGDIAEVDVSPGNPLVVQSGSFLAHSQNVDVSAAVGSLQSIALREGATTLIASGEGSVVIAAYGGLERFNLNVGEQLVVDSGHIAAWSASLGFRVGPLKGIVSSALTGEGIVGEFTGPGTVFVQTRAEQQLRSWIFPEREQDRR
jgi:uncharacterized protein (TIGR00266 family)